MRHRRWAPSLGAEGRQPPKAKSRPHWQAASLVQGSERQVHSEMPQGVRVAQTGSARRH